MPVANRTKKFSKEELIELLKIDGYKIEFPQTWDVHGQARLICYVSEEVKYVRQTLGSEYDHIPSITLDIGLGKANRTVVHYYYREWTNGITGESDNQSQLTDLKTHIKQWTELCRTSKSFVALGDANLCALRWNNNDFKHKDLAHEVQQFLLDESCYQITNKYTRIQGNNFELQQSCLDHVTTNVPEKCNIPEVFPVGSSDHLPIMVTKFSREVKNQPKTIRKRNYRHFDPTEFLKDIQTHVASGSFVKVLNSSNINEASSIFSGLFGSIINKHAPLKVFQVRNNYVPWISQETKQMIKYRDQLFMESRSEHCIEKFEAYKRLRNRINARLQLDELNYYKTKFYNEDSSTSAHWRLVNDYLNTPNSSFKNTPTTIKHQGRTFTRPKDIANALNTSFLDKVARIKSSLNNAVEIDPVERLKKYIGDKLNNSEKFQLVKIDMRGLREILKKRKGNRSCGIDNIDGYSIKLAAPLIEDVLLHLVNLSIDSSEYPYLWKVNKVSPHYKKGDKSLGDNWRPVTDIVFVSKLAEAAVLDQVTEYFSKKKLWHSNHHGFRAHHSTATALTQILDVWINNAEKKELTAALLLDLSSAFDVVSHSILIDKLKTYNFSDKTIAWFKSYLANRTQVVVVESKVSDRKQVGEQGIPQGSLLGPILFLIFYNDFPAVRKEGISVLYADDNTDNVCDPDPASLEEKIQAEADLSTSWVHDNQLVCSGSKTKLLIVSTKELRRSKLNDKIIAVNVAGHRVEESNSERLLGLTVNNSMTWESHLYGDGVNKGLVQKLCQRAGVISKLALIMPKHRLKTVAEGIFFSLLNYCIDVYGNVWGLHSMDEDVRHSSGFRKEDNRKLQTIVNKVLRALCNERKDTSTADLCEKSGQLSVHQRTAMVTLCSIFRIIKFAQPSYLYSALTLSEESCRTRNSKSSNCRRVEYNLSLSRSSFLYRGSRLFNMLPPSMVEVPHVRIFKKMVKKWVRNNIPLQPP